MNLSHYSKSIVALVGTVLTWAGVAYVPDGSVGRVEWYALAVALATAAGVYGVSNSVVVQRLSPKVATPVQAATESIAPPGVTPPSN